MYKFILVVFLLFSSKLYSQNRAVKFFQTFNAPNQLQMPDFKATTFEGKKIDTKRMRDSIIVLNIWSIACKPCRQEIPDLNRLVKKYSKREVIFLSLCIDNEEFLSSFYPSRIPRILYKLIPNSGYITTQFDKLFNLRNGMVVPTHFIIDKKGKIVFKGSGLLVKEIDKEIEHRL